MKTLLDFKNELANQTTIHGYRFIDWEDLNRISENKLITKYEDIAITLFAEYLFDQGCKSQKQHEISFISEWLENHLSFYDAFDLNESGLCNNPFKTIS